MPASRTIAATATGTVRRMREPGERERVVGEGDGHGGDGAGGDDEEQRPAVQERGQRSPGLAQVDVAAAGARAPLAELAVAEGADEGDRAAEHPGGEREARRADPFGDRGRRPEDPATDDAADDGHRCGEEAQPARVGRHPASQVERARLETLSRTQSRALLRIGVSPAGRGGTAVALASRRAPPPLAHPDARAASSSPPAASIRATIRP